MKPRIFGEVFLVSFFLFCLAGCKQTGEKKLFLPSRTPAPEAVEQDFVSADIVFDFGGGEAEEIEGVQTEEKTAFGLLKAATEKQGLDLEFDESDFGVFVKRIGEKANSENKFWQFWVNGQFADKAADKFEIKDGDLVEWKYKESQF